MRVRTNDPLLRLRGTGNWLNVTYASAWLVLTFAVQPGTALAATLENAFSILIPGFAFYQGIGKLEVAAVNRHPFTAGDTFDYDRGVLKACVFLLFDTLCFSAGIFCVDTKFFQRMLFAARNAGDGGDGGAGAAVGSESRLDDDQRALREKLGPPVIGTTPEQRSTDAVHAEQLCKRYEVEGGRGSVQAVHCTSIGARPNTITGLLGPNGAGKSTMVSMMSGVESVDSGDSWINQASIVTENANARRMLGLCPQFDALMGMLTGREQLMLFAAIRGVPDALCAEMIQRAWFCVLLLLFSLPHPRIAILLESEIVVLYLLCVSCTGS